MPVRDTIPKGITFEIVTDQNNPPRTLVALEDICVPSLPSLVQLEDDEYCREYGIAAWFEKEGLARELRYVPLRRLYIQEHKVTYYD